MVWSWCVISISSSTIIKNIDKIAWNIYSYAIIQKLEYYKKSSLIFSDSNNPFLLLILKWGGELTELGRQQAQELGKRFRCMYPGSRDDNSGAQDGLGFLRLHSTYRHDLKIYASDEGRVQTTAAAFAKGLLGSFHYHINFVLNYNSF